MTMRRSVTTVFLVPLFFIVAVIFPARQARSASNEPITGYAWSDTIGWVSAEASDITGCPISSCQPHIATDGTVSGWLKALSGGTSQSGRWDGWIQLAARGNGVQVGTDGSFSGFAWGSDVVGWVDFRYARTNYTCVPKTPVCTADKQSLDNGCEAIPCPYAAYGFECDDTVTPNQCAIPPFPNGSIKAVPAIAHIGQTVQVIWNVANANAHSCVVKGSNGDQWSGMASSPPAGETSGGILGETTYTIHCDSAIAGIGSYDGTIIVIPAPTFYEP